MPLITLHYFNSKKVQEAPLSFLYANLPPGSFPHTLHQSSSIYLFIYLLIYLLILFVELIYEDLFNLLIQKHIHLFILIYYYF